MSNNLVTLSKGQQAVTGLPIGKLNDLERRIAYIEQNPVSGIGYTIETPSGTVNGSNTTFTVTNTPVYLVIDGATYFENAGYTIAGLTITTATEPSSFIRSFY